MLAAVRSEQDAMDDSVSLTAGTISPVEFFDPTNVQRLLGAALAV